MSKARNWLSFICLGLLLSLAAAGAELRLAVRGQAPEYSIVLSAEAVKPLVNVANELQKLVAEMTGVTLPIVRDSEALPAKAILIGDSRHSRAVWGAGYPYDGLDDDSFAMKAVGPHVLIVGKKRGGQYGVYELLERFAGCRWYASWHSVIPRQDVLAVPAELDELQKPAFLMREPFWYDMFSTMQALHNKCNGNRMDLSEAENGGKIRFGGGLFVHTANRLVPPGEFFDKHPEYFSEIKGKRVRDHSQLCLTNPDVLKIVKERMLAHIRKDPTGTLYSFSQNDWRNYCECANCKALAKKTGTQSGVMIWFVNQVAEAVEKEFPHALIETLAYQYTREPPSGIRPRHNVVPRLCTIECDFSRPIGESTLETNQKFLKDISGWAAMTDKMYIWDYTTNFPNYVGPFPNFYALQGNIKLFRDCHVIGIMEQGAYQGYHGDFAELKGWVLAKLLWNPDLDIKVLLDDFMKGYYGPAAPFVRQYFDELHALATAPEMRVIIWDSMNSKYLPAEFLVRAEELWMKAEAAVADSPRYLYNVRKGALSVLYARFMRLPAENIKMEWKDGQIVSIGVSAERQRLAKACLDRFEGPRPVRLAESQPRHDSIVLQWKQALGGYEVKTAKAGEWNLGVAPAQNGMAGLLRGADGYNYLDGNRGGISFRNNLLGAANNFTPGQCTEDTIRAGYVQRSHYRINEMFKVRPDGLRAEFKLSNELQQGAVTCYPALTLAFHLDIGANVSYRVGKGAWTTTAVAADALQDFVRMPNDVLKAGMRLEIASPKSGRGVSVQLPANLPGGNVNLQLFPQSGTVVLQGISRIRMAGGESQTYVVDIQPLASCQGLPASVAVDSSKGGRLIQEDAAMSFSRPDEWAVRVVDEEAMDKSAIKMFGTHYEWCFDSKVDLHQLTPGMAYKLRARIKVEKAKATGEAFWMGVYDRTDKTSYFTYTINVSKVKDGYQWYDIGTWTPNAAHSQWIWAGPGRFDRKKGETSAVKAVYIDRIELVPVQGK